MVDLSDADVQFQNDALQRVSRTFALTIPQLPAALEYVVANAYLLCRIADTIEDDPGIAIDTKQALHDALLKTLHAPDDATATAFVTRVTNELTPATADADRDLVAETARVMRIHRAFGPPQRAAVARCVEKMCRGMPQFQTPDTRRGLADLSELDRYCYYVAGVVGEMLTELFCNHAEDIAVHRDELTALAPSFGQGLQMTNILKDIWDDLDEGICWLPRAHFSAFGVELERLGAGHDADGFAAALHELVAIAHGHLRNALAYTLLIPPRHDGIRRFCAWAVGLAVLTLARIDAHPAYRGGADVKVSRRTVALVTSVTRASIRQDWVLRWLFGIASRRLPLREITLAAPARAP